MAEADDDGDYDTEDGQEEGVDVGKVGPPVVGPIGDGIDPRKVVEISEIAGEVEEEVDRDGKLEGAVEENALGDERFGGQEDFVQSKEEEDDGTCDDHGDDRRVVVLAPSIARKLERQEENNPSESQKQEAEDV